MDDPRNKLTSVRLIFSNLKDILNCSNLAYTGLDCMTYTFFFLFIKNKNLTNIKCKMNHNNLQN